MDILSIKQSFFVDVQCHRKKIGTEPGQPEEPIHVAENPK